TESTEGGELIDSHSEMVFVDSLTDKIIHMSGLSKQMIGQKFTVIGVNPTTLRALCVLRG
ncbi:MAG: hypothetical protein ACKOLA_14245, partial [Spartobacteria bacterium]